MNYYIKKETWEQMYSFFITLKGIHKNEDNLRKFIEAVWYIARSGCQWRLLPVCYGKWGSTHQRFIRWEKAGIWKKAMEYFIDSDLEWIMIDATIIRAHACSAGYKKESQEKEALGRSVGGFTSKIHALVDALGNPLRFLLTPGQRHDVTQAQSLIKGYKNAFVLADKAYDSDELILYIKDNQNVSVIPPKSNRLILREYDKHIYKERNLIECFFGKIKHFRRVFSRFDKRANTFLAFLYFVGMLIWLR